MPTYTYSCPKCKKEIELIQSIKNRLAPHCVEPGCDGGVEMETVLHPAGFVLKGNSWARDGYK
jgi:putative FmdB family regulatory protein